MGLFVYMALVYSDTTTKLGLIQRCEFWTQLGDTGISGDATLLKQFTGNINAAVHDLFIQALQSQDGWDIDDPNQDYGVGTMALTTNRDYPWALTEEIVNIKRIDVCWGGTSGVCYKAEPIDSSEISAAMGNDTNLDMAFSRTNPRYDLKANSIWLYPKATSADVTASGIMRLEFAKSFSEFASTDTTKRVWVDAPFHELIAVKASYMWNLLNKSDNGSLLNRMEQFIALGEDKFKKHYGKKDLDKTTSLQGFYDNYE